MINSFHNYIIKNDFGKMLIFAIIIISINIIILNVFTSPFFSFLLLFISLYVFIHYLYIRDVYFSLLLFSLLELIYIDKAFSRHFQNVVAQNVFLYFFAFLFLIVIALGVNVNEKHKYQTKIGRSIILFFFYFSLMGVLGFLKGYSKTNLVIEFYQLIYYLLFFPIFYLINKRKYYNYFISIFLFVCTIIAVEYIIMNIVLPYRFITVHNLLFPFAVGILIAFIRERSKNQIYNAILIISLIVILIGSFFIGARALWAAIFLTLISFYLIHLFLDPNSRNKALKTFLLFVFTMGIVGYIVSQKSKVKFQPKDIKDRVESLSDPLEDKSFLMRVEINLLGYKRFIKSPIWGEGLGNTIQFKILENTKVTFPDNSFLYFAWKGGIIGLFLFLLILFRTIQSLLFVIKNTNNLSVRNVMIGISSGMSGFLLLGLLQANFIAFRILFVFIFFLAYVEFERKLSINEKKEK